MNPNLLVKIASFLMFLAICGIIGEIVYALIKDDDDCDDDDDSPKCTSTTTTTTLHPVNYAQVYQKAGYQQDGYQQPAYRYYEEPLQEKTVFRPRPAPLVPEESKIFKKIEDAEEYLNQMMTTNDNNPVATTTSDPPMIELRRIEPRIDVQSTSIDLQRIPANDTKTDKKTDGSKLSFTSLLGQINQVLPSSAMPTIDSFWPPDTDKPMIVDSYYLRVDDCSNDRSKESITIDNVLIHPTPIDLINDLLITARINVTTPIPRSARVQVKVTKLLMGYFPVSVPCQKNFYGTCSFFLCDFLHVHREHQFFEYLQKQGHSFVCPEALKPNVYQFQQMEYSPRNDKYLKTITWLTSGWYRILMQIVDGTPLNKRLFCLRSQFYIQNDEEEDIF